MKNNAVMEDVFKNFDLLEKYKWLITEGSEDAYTGDAEKNDISLDIDDDEYITQDSDMMNNLKNSLVKNNVLNKSLQSRTPIDKDKKASIIESFQKVYARILRKVLENEKDTSNIKHNFSTGDINALKQQKNKFPVFLYENPNHIDDSYLAIEKGTYFEPRKILIITTLSEDISKLNVYSKAAIEAKDLENSPELDYLKGKDVWEFLVSNDKKNEQYFYADTSDYLYIVKLFGYGTIYAKQNVNNLITKLLQEKKSTLDEGKIENNNNKGIVTLFRGPSLNYFQNIEDAGITEAKPIEISGKEFFIDKNGIYTANSNYSKGKDKLPKILELVLDKKYGTEGSKGMKPYIDSFIKLGNYDESSKLNSKEKYNYIWRFPTSSYIQEKYGNDFPIWSVAYNGYNRMYPINGEFIATNGQRIKVRDLNSLNELIHNIFNSQDIEISRMFAPFKAKIKQEFNNIIYDKNEIELIDSGNCNIDSCVLYTLMFNGIIHNNDFGTYEITAQNDSRYELVFKAFRQANEYTADNGKIEPLDIKRLGYKLPVGMTIDHINGVHTANTIWNLRIVTRGFNSSYSNKFGIIKYTIVETAEYDGKTVSWELGFDDNYKVSLPIGTDEDGKRLTFPYENKYSLSIEGDLSENNVDSKESTTSATRKTVTLTSKILAVTERNKRKLFATEYDLINSGFYYAPNNAGFKELSNNKAYTIRRAAETEGGNIGFANNINKKDVVEFVQNTYSNILKRQQPIVAKKGKDTLTAPTKPESQDGQGTDVKEKNSTGKEAQSQKAEKNKSTFSYELEKPEESSTGKEVPLAQQISSNYAPNTVNNRLTEATTFEKNVKKESASEKLSLSDIHKLLRDIMKEEFQYYNNNKDIPLENYISGYNSDGVVFQIGVRSPNEDIKSIESSLTDSWRACKYVNTSKQIDKNGTPLIYGVYDEKGSRKDKKKYIPYISLLGRLGLMATNEKKMMIQKKNGYFSGYPATSFYIEGTTTKKQVKLHVLSASGWKEDIFKKEIKNEYVINGNSENVSLIVHHINGNVGDFRPDNLTWINGRDNTLFDVGNGVGLFRVFPEIKESDSTDGRNYDIREKEVPIAAWLSESDFKEFINTPKSNGEKGQDIIDPFSKKSINFSDVNIDSKLNISATIPQNAKSPSNEYVYILRRTVMKDVQRGLYKTPSDRVKDIIGIEQKTIDKQKKEHINYISTDNSLYQFDTDLNSMDSEQLLMLYLKGHISYAVLKSLYSKQAENLSSEDIDKLIDKKFVEHFIAIKKNKDIETRKSDIVYAKDKEMEMLKIKNKDFSRDAIYFWEHTNIVTDREKAGLLSDIYVRKLEAKHQDFLWDGKPLLYEGNNIETLYNAKKARADNMAKMLFSGEVNPDSLSEKMFHLASFSLEMDKRRMTVLAKMSNNKGTKENQIENIAKLRYFYIKKEFDTNEKLLKQRIQKLQAN